MDARGGEGLHRQGPGRYALVGPVGFRTAGELLAASSALFKGESRIQVDLGGVTDVDSAGLALLLEWLSMARRQGQVVSFAGIPEKLLALARLSGVEEMLSDGDQSATASSSSSSPSSSNSSR
jgi:phospholipid transport system transporter-binding protein